MRRSLESALRATLAAVLLAGSVSACGGSASTQDTDLYPMIAPGSENEAESLRITSMHRPTFPTVETYEVRTLGFGSREDGQGVTLSRIRSYETPPPPPEHEIHTQVWVGGWLALHGAFYHYIRAERSGDALTMVFGRKISVPMHDAHAFLAIEGDRLLAGQRRMLNIKTIESDGIVVSVGRDVSAHRVGEVIALSDRTRWKLLAVGAASATSGTPAYAEMLRLEDAPEAAAPAAARSR